VIVNASLAGVAPDSACNELQFSSGAGSRWSGHRRRSIPNQTASLKKNHVELLRDCECVPQGVAPDSATPSCRRGFSVALEVGTAEIYCRARPRHSKKIVTELLRDCECVPQVAPDSAYNEAQEFLSGAALGGHRRRSMPTQAAASSKKIIMELLRDCECVPRRSGARLGCNELQDI
jgi:hypothetical protein